MTNRLLCLSDLHLAPAGPLCNFHTAQPLADFLTQAVQPDTTLVLNGDIFDLLQTPNRPARLDLSQAPELLRTHLQAMQAQPEARAVLDALATALRTGAPCVLLPGNHDAELAHPGCLPVLRQLLNLGDAPNLALHNSTEPWRTSVGRYQIVVGHGHRGDGWNDVDPAALRRAIETAAALDLPPGSRLVTEVLSAFHQAVDPVTGQPRFPFIDLLKPEVPAVPLLLLYLDPRMALQHLPLALLGLGARALLRDLGRRLRGGPVLGPPSPTPQAPQPAEQLASLIAADLPPDLRAAPDRVLHDLERFFEGGATTAAAPDMLAAHGGLGARVLRGAFLRAASYDDTFFQRDQPGAMDQPMIDQELPEGTGPKVLLAGHTHAAKEIHLPGERCYLNTGTWTDLMALPRLNDDDAVKAFIDALERNQINRRRHLTYAEVTPAGAQLRELP